MLNRVMLEEAVLKSARKPGELEVSNHGISSPFNPHIGRTKVSLCPDRKIFLSWMLLLREGMERVEVGFQSGIRPSLAPWETGCRRARLCSPFCSGRFLWSEVYVVAHVMQQ